MNKLSEKNVTYNELRNFLKYNSHRGKVSNIEVDHIEVLDIPEDVEVFTYVNAKDIWGVTFAQLDRFCGYKLGDNVMISNNTFNSLPQE